MFHTRGPRVLAALLALLTAGAALPATTAAGAGTGTAELTVDHRLERLPDRPGHVRVTAVVTVPDGVETVTLEPPENATTVGTGGFTAGNGRYRWERGDGGDPRLSYVLSVDRSDGGTLESTGTGEWALFNWRTVDTRWGYTAAAGTDVAVTERANPAGEGVVGPAFAYLGPYESHERTVDGERLRLVVPEAARMVEPPERVVDALAGASRSLDVGARNERLTVFVAPDPIEASGRLSRLEVGGRQDAAVAADEPLGTADNAWFHEYVHSRQAYETRGGMGWFDDASAEYYAARLAHEGGCVSEAAFYEYVRTDEAEAAVLAEAESVDDDASYFKGMRVLAALDAEIREASGGERSLERVVRATNAHEGPVDRAAFAGLVAETAGTPLDGWLDRYVGTSATPDVPRVPTDRDRGTAPTPVTDGLDGVTLVGGGLFLAALCVGLFGLGGRAGD